MNKLLMVIDFQNDFVTGSLGTLWARETAPNIEKKIKEYYEKGIDIIFTQDTHTEIYLNTHEGKMLPILHCEYETDGWAIVNDLNKYGITILKSTFGDMSWSLRIGNCTNGRLECNYDEIEVIGLCTDICVISNALILRSTFPEVEIVVDASCCAGTFRTLHECALNVMESCQIKVVNRE